MTYETRGCIDCVKMDENVYECQKTDYCVRDHTPPGLMRCLLETTSMTPIAYHEKFKAEVLELATHVDSQLMTESDWTEATSEEIMEDVWRFLKLCDMQPEPWQVKLTADLHKAYRQGIPLVVDRGDRAMVTRWT